jgi:hypothetical protein
MQQPTPTKSPEGTWKGLILLALLVGILGAAMFAATLPRITPADADRVAAAASGVSALFSGLAFAGVIYALSLQRRELALQREELAQTRQELSQQNETLSLQRFETTLFNLVRAHRDIVTTMTARFAGQSSEAYTGLHAYALAASELSGRFVMELRPEPSNTQFMALADDWFSAVCYQPAAEFGHYFRSLFHVLRFITEAEIDHKWPYILLVRSQLSNAELTLLFFYGLTSDGRGLKTYIERYHLLRGLRLNPGLERHRQRYKSAAFGATRRTRLDEPPELAV